MQGLCLACKIQSSHQWRTRNKCMQKNKNKIKALRTIPPQIVRNRQQDTCCVLPAWHFCLVWPPQTEYWGLCPLHSDGPLHSASSRLYQPETFGPSYWPPGKKKKREIRKIGWQHAFRVKINAISWSAQQWWSYSLFSRPASLFLALSFPRVIQLTNTHAQTHSVALPVIWRVPA